MTCLWLMMMTACGEKDDDTGTSGDDTATTPPSEDLEPPPLLSDCEGYDSRTATIYDAVITDDTLTLSLSYGGGCETHEWSLCWPGQSFAESEPVQVSLALWHDANGDNCDAGFKEDRDFDLTTLRESWTTAYQQESGTITVNIDDFSVPYSF